MTKANLKGIAIPPAPSSTKVIHGGVGVGVKSAMIPYNKNGQKCSKQNADYFEYVEYNTDGIVVASKLLYAIRKYA